MKKTIPNLFRMLFALLMLGWSSGLKAQTYSGGTGTAGDPYQIHTLQDLLDLSGNSADWASYFKQTADLIFPGPNLGDGFSPIGSSSYPFTGSYDGDSHTISNLFINRPSTDDIGLFGATGDPLDPALGVVKNLGLLNVDITGQSDVGALGGVLNIADNCYTTGTVTGAYYVGGLAGFISIGTNCHSFCNVNGSDYIGGFSGWNLWSVNQCYASGNVVGSSNVGGFLGINDAASAVACYSTGSVSGTSYTGGFAGTNSNSGNIQNCFATGSVSGTNDVGGLVGASDGVSSVQFSFSKGGVSGGTHAGGLIGWLDAGGIIENCFWDKVTSGMVASAGGTGKTTAELKRVGTYLSDPSLSVAWDFTLATNLWGFNGTDNNGYPFLRFQGYMPGHIWLGTSSSDWASAGNWSENTEPGSGKNVIVPDVIFDPVIAGAGKVAANLGIEPGGLLTLAAGGELTVNGTLTNSAGTSGLIVESDGSLIENSTGVAASVNKDITDAASDRWHLFISPLTSSIQATASSCFNGAYLDRYNEPAGEWVRLLTNESVTPDIGYSLSFPGGYNPLVFNGVLKSSPITYTNLSYTSGAPGYLDGWNLVGNPYTCGIDPALCSVPDGINAFAYVWDGTAGNYSTLSLGTNTIPGTIASLQGFFVRTNSGTNSLVLPNLAKIHSGTFLKADAIVPEMIKLKITGNGFSDEAYIRFNSASTPGFDQEFDAYKMDGMAEAPQLYSLLPAEKAAVNALPSIDACPEVPLGLKVGAGATYSLRVTGIESYNAETPLLLEDMKTNTIQDLRQNPVCVFEAFPGDAELRFKVHFKKTNGIDETAGNQFGIYSSQHLVCVSNPKSLTGTIEVYDIAGRLLQIVPLSGNKLDQIRIADFTGTLLVKILTPNDTTCGKVFVN